MKLTQIDEIKNEGRGVIIGEQNNGYWLRCR
jgi:hypothetical protein